MKNLKIKVDGIEKIIGITDQFSPGIYLVNDTKVVISNCKILSIDIGTKNSQLELRHRVTKLGNLGILTIEVLDDYRQYFIFKNVDIDDFKDLLNNFPPESKKELQLAYTYSKL